MTGEIPQFQVVTWYARNAFQVRGFTLSSWAPIGGKTTEQLLKEAHQAYGANVVLIRSDDTYVFRRLADETAEDADGSTGVDGNITTAYYMGPVPDSLKGGELAEGASPIDGDLTSWEEAVTYTSKMDVHQQVIHFLLGTQANQTNLEAVDMNNKLLAGMNNENFIFSGKNSRVYRQSKKIDRHFRGNLFLYEKRRKIVIFMSIMLATLSFSALVVEFMGWEWIWWLTLVAILLMLISYIIQVTAIASKDASKRLFATPSY